MKISEILTDLAWNYKGGHGTDKNRCKKWGHSYGKAYDHLFSHFKKYAKLDIIEIGTEYGGSLYAWRRFFPNATITGIDIEDKVEHKASDINYLITDVKEFKPIHAYDIVIDDGSHKLSDVLYTVENFKLKVGGVMVIEDCQAPVHWFEAVQKRTKYFIELIDLRGEYGQKDDYLIALHNYGYNIQLLQ